MSLMQQPPSDGQHPPSSGLTLNLSQNNPFRKGPSSPAIQGPPSPGRLSNGLSLDRPVSRSRNPFLDNSEDMEGRSGGQRLDRRMNGRTSPSKLSPVNNAADMFSSLSLLDKPKTENMPPSTNGKVRHRLTKSEEEEMRLRHGRPRPTEELDIFADPPANGISRERRPRRNSESSISVDHNGKPLDPEEERRRRERRRQERDSRGKDGKPGSIRQGSISSRPKKPNQRLDIIDKLDVTSIYGTGLFHHDGPFDACNPHRNRKGSTRAPMQAFPKDSASMSLGGAGPVNKNINLALFHGRGAEGFTDYNVSGANAATEYEPYAGAEAPRRGDSKGVDRTAAFNPLAKADVVHGDETMGLGTTTFLEGAPAARVAIQRRESESEVNGVNHGLSRKRSLAQKIRGISSVKTFPQGQPGVSSPEPRPQTAVPSGVQSAGGLGKIAESNPFFNDYDDAYAKKGAKIQVAEEQKAAAHAPARARAPSSPQATNQRNPLERSFTVDSPPKVPNDSADGKSGGFLSRVKSLRGGRRPRPQRDSE